MVRMAFLHAAVRIHLRARLAAREITDRHRDPVFAALRLRLDSLDQPTTHQRELELACPFGKPA